MAKRRTRKQKIRAGGFQINLSDLPSKRQNRHKPLKKIEANYLRIDLTKVFVLTMLALALELAIWLRFSR